MFFLARRLDKPFITYLSDYDEIDELVGLRMGANDVLHADMSVNILCERIMAVHRRHKAMHDWSRDILSDRARLIPSSYFVDVMRNKFWIKDQRFDFTKAEINIVKTLLKHRGGIVSREELAANISNVPGKTTDTKSIDSHIKRIRKKIHRKKQTSELILSVYGRG